MKKKNMTDRVRMLIQIIFFIMAPSIYSASFTAIKNAFTSIGAGKPLEISGFTIQLIIVIVYTILFGRFFCGWACAFGAINDWIYSFSHWIQKKTKKKLPAIPERLCNILALMKYVVLVILLILCFMQKGNLITPNSPWTIFSLIRSRHLQITGYEIGIILLIILIIGMFFQERFFCRFFCPMGAIFSLLPVMPFVRLKRKPDTCPERCGACKKVCPVDMKMEDNSLNMGECIRCGRCSNICPKGNISSLGKLTGGEWWINLVKALLLFLLISK